MSEQEGIAQTQYAAGAASGGSGSIAMGAAAVIPAASTLQISNAGGRDWMCLPAHTGLQDEFDTSIWHWKLLDGWMRRSFNWYGPSGTITMAASATSTLAITATHLDDGHLSGASGADDLNANVTGVLMTANTTIAFTGFGFAFTAPASKKIRTLNLYMAFSPGGGVTSGVATITARLSDGSFRGTAVTIVT